MYYDPDLNLPFPFLQKYRDRLRDKLEQAFPEMQADLEQVDRAALQSQS